MSADPIEAAGQGSLQPWADTLTGVAESALDHGLAHGEPPAVDPAEHPGPLREPRAAFVTLRNHAGELRGCVGSIEAHRPLVADVAHNAFAAAFRDPRFPPLTPAERPRVRCELSILTPPEPVAFEGEADLLARLEPGRDGVLLIAGDRRATLLPQVWEHLPDPHDFWHALKQKAGLPAHVSALDLAVYRYRAESLQSPAGREDGIEAGTRPERPSP